MVAPLGSVALTRIFPGQETVGGSRSTTITFCGLVALLPQARMRTYCRQRRRLNCFHGLGKTTH
jgi:hypothetical protein